MKQQRWSFNRRLCISTLLGLIWMTPAQAQQLRSAELYRLDNNNVRLLLRGKPERQAKIGDRLVPLDALKTFNATARLRFNEGSLAFVDRSTVFRFKPGLRRQNLRSFLCGGYVPQLADKSAPPCPPVVASANLAQVPNAPETPEEGTTILEVLSGVVLVIVPPDGQVTTVETPKSQVAIEAEARAATPSSSDSSSKAAPSPISPNGNAALIVHQGGTTQVFALTEGLTVADPSGRQTVAPLGGQAVQVTAAGVGEPFEFDLKEFYRTYPLASVLGPGQEGAVAQAPALVQQTLSTVRVATLDAVEAQESRLSGFRNTFLGEALYGADSDLYRGQPVVYEPDATVQGVFTVTVNDDPVFAGTFTPDPDSNIPANSFFPLNVSPGTSNFIQVNTDLDTIVVDGVGGTASSAGLSGNNAAATFIPNNGDGRFIRVLVDVGDDINDLDVGDRRRGTLTIGTPPDR